MARGPAEQGGATRDLPGPSSRSRQEALARVEKAERQLQAAMDRLACVYLYGPAPDPPDLRPSGTPARRR